MTMGISKHRKSGTSPKSPKLKYMMKLAAEGKMSVKKEDTREGKKKRKDQAWITKRKNK